MSDIDLNVSVTVRIEDLARQPKKDLVEFVKELDLAVADWDFTLRLCDHFAKLMQVYREERDRDGKPVTP